MFLGISIKSSNGCEFLRNLPTVAKYFQFLGKPNYARACLLMSIYHTYWVSKQFPFVDSIHENFKAFSEEKGESSIHLLLSRIRDYQIDEDNINEKYKDVAAFMECDQFFNIHLHADSYSQTYHITPTDKKNSHDLFLKNIKNSMLIVIDKIILDDHLPYLEGLPSYKKSSPLATKVQVDAYYLYHFNSYNQSSDETSKLLYKLKRTLTKYYKKPRNFSWVLQDAKWR